MQSVNTVIRSNSLRWLGAALAAATVLWACGGGGSSPDSTTPPQLQPNAATSWELMTAGDIADCRLQPSGDSDAFKTGQLVKRQLADAGDNSNVLTLGDNAYLLGLSIGYEECYQKTWGDFLPKTFVIPGNHDYESNGENNYFRYFGAKANPDGKQTGYYRIDQNGWTVFALSSVVDATAASAQAAWLKAQLAAGTQSCIAAAWHHPMFSSAEQGGDKKMIALWDILQVAKADVVLQAHQHHYERFAPTRSDGSLSADGLRSFVVGSGGAKKFGFATVSTGSERQVEAYGIMRLSLSKGNAKWKFIDVDNIVHDQGSFDCRPKP